MSAKVTEVIKRHYESAVRYAEAMESAKDKQDYISAMKTCAKEVKAQYEELQSICEEYAEMMALGTADEELKKMAQETGDCFGVRISRIYSKMALFLTDAEFKKSEQELYQVLTENPLFMGAMEDDGNLDFVAQSFAGSVNAMAEKLNAETTEVSEENVAELEAVLKEFDSLAKRYAVALEKADTVRKFVTANDLFVEAVKKLIPRMNTVADAMRLLVAKNALPEAVSEAGKSLRNTLGKELGVILKEKRDLMTDAKVKKSVEKIGKLLESLPF
jgi:hypothetical protein